MDIAVCKNCGLEIFCRVYSHKWNHYPRDRISRKACKDPFPKLSDK